MKLITIYNYPDDENYNKQCLWWFSQALKNSGNMPIEIWFEIEPPVMYEIKFISLLSVNRDIKFVKKDRVDLSEYIPSQYIDDKCSHNVGFKLWNLCKEEDPFIFVDADAIILEPLDYLVQRATKPIIMVDHQTIKGHTDFLPYNFLNSGVQVCADPSILNFNDIIKSFLDIGGYLCPGTDQAMLFGYFRSLEYDYTHPEIGFGWNSCAGFTMVIGDNALCYGLGDEYPVYINHYWYTYKPWTINCPLFNRFRKREKP